MTPDVGSISQGGMMLFWILFYLLAPALVVWLCRKVAFFAKIGSILLLYFIGILVSNLFVFPYEELAQELYPIQDLLTSLTIPLAMPLILFACDFKNWPMKKALVSLLTGLFSVITMVVAGYYLFSGHSGDPEFNKVAGMAVGVYTGGTPNLAAIKMMLDADETTYVLMNSFDMLVSFLYLTFLMAAGIKCFRKLIPLRKEDETDNVAIHPSEEHVTTGQNDMYRHIFTKEHFSKTLAALGLSLLIAGIGLGVSLLFTGKINMILLILTLTTLAIAASFHPSVRKMTKSYDVGMYLVLIFSLVVASMVNIRNICFDEGMWLLIYIAFTIFGSLFLQVLFARLFKVDADTTVITSVTLVNSPLFVPMIADCMKNKKVIITGITIGVIGYAIGNYIGVLIAGLLGV